MANSEISDYIKETLGKGYTPEQIRKALIDSGWPANQVDDELGKFSRQNKSPPVPLPNVPTRVQASVPISIQARPVTAQPAAQPSVNQRPMGIIEKFRTVLLRPSDFFGRIKPDMSFGNPFKFYLFILIINTVLSVALAFTLFPQLAMLGGLGAIIPVAGLLTAALIIGIPIILLLLIIGISLITAILHVFAYLFGARKGFVSTYKALMYSSAPAVFSIPMFLNIPWASIIIGGIIFVWAIIILVKGLSKLHEISVLRAFLAVLTPILIVLAIILVLAFSIFMALMPYFLGLGGAPTVPLY